MKLKCIVAGLLAAASINAMAADQTVQIYTVPPTAADNHFYGANKTASGAPDALLSGGSDIITLTGLSSGQQYKVTVTLSGQNVTLFDTSNLNGVKATVNNFGQYVFGYVTAVGESPFTLSLFGKAGAGATYSGDITVTAVPEPETYGMMLGGLGLLGFMARRRKAKNAA